jgi:hypothetical protein
MDQTTETLRTLLLGTWTEPVLRYGENYRISSDKFVAQAKSLVSVGYYVSYFRYKKRSVDINNGPTFFSEIHMQYLANSQ